MERFRPILMTTLAAMLGALYLLSLLLIWVVLAVLSVLAVNIAPFIASAGVLGLAIGFGAQQLFAQHRAIWDLLEARASAREW